MMIIVNGQSLDLEAGNLAEALETLGYPSKGIATAVNGAFISALERPNTGLKPGDRLEVVAPMQGG